MAFRFTCHALEKFDLMKQAGFPLTKVKIQRTISKPRKKEDRSDGTCIATTLLDDRHVLRVVYRHEGKTIVVITFYPGRKAAYGL